MGTVRSAPRTMSKGFFRTLSHRARLLLPILFLVLFIAPQSASAQASLTVGYDQFKCLFEKTNSNGACNPNPSATDIKTGAASGVVYGKTNDFTEQGIKTITMQIGLWVNIEKEKSENKYFFSRVADDRDESFFLRLKYVEPITGLPFYKFIPIAYQEDNVAFSGNILNPVGQIETVNIPTSSGNPSQVKVAFYKIGTNGYEVVKQQVVNVFVDPGNGVVVPFGSTISADFWYCGGEKKGKSETDGRYAPREPVEDTQRVEYFTNSTSYTDINGPHTDGVDYGEEMCDGEAAYKIGKTETFQLPTKETVQADSERELSSGIVASEYIGSILPLCSITPFGNGSVMGCVAQILYGGVFRPVAFFAQLMGQLFDFFLGYSLSDESYRHEFVQTGWRLVRDISNIFFIIIMIYSGLMAVFNSSSVSYKKVIPTLIINALIINFSLFATRIIIDMSNITARIFYNQMVVKVDGEEQKAENSTTGYKPISEAIVSSFNPQSILKNSVLTGEGGKDSESTESDTADFNSQSSSVPTAGSNGFKRYEKEYASYFALVTLISIAIMFAVAMMFWKTAFMFVGRVVGLYVAMIFSPFAFLSRGGVPLVSKLPSLNYSAWWNDLVNYSLLAPVFVFFLYIINAFLNVEFFTKVGLDQNGQGFFGSVMYVVIPMLIIYGLISQGVAVAKKFAGKYGEMAQNIMGKGAGVVVGGALGVATGGIAVAGRNVIGRLGTRLASSQTLQNASSRGGVLGGLADRVIRSGSTLSRSNYDARNIGFINNRLREVGATNTSLGGILGTNQSNTAGGFRGAIDREVATQTARADRMLVTGAQAATQDARNTAWENVYQTMRNTAQQAANVAGTVFDENTFRADYITNQATAGNARPQTTAEINRQREQQNNARLARPSALQNIARRVTNRVTTPLGTAGAATSGAGLAAGVATTAITGAGAVVAATVIGQGAIQNAAQEQVLRQRAGNARDPIASQRARLQTRLDQLQAELTRRIAVMNTIGATLGATPPITYDTLTPANIIDYQRDRQNDINTIQTSIDNDNDFIDRNKNDPAQVAAVNAARTRVRSATNQQNTHRNDMRQAGNILNEYNRLQTDISGVRQTLGI